MISGNTFPVQKKNNNKTTYQLFEAVVGVFFFCQPKCLHHKENRNNKMTDKYMQILTTLMSENLVVWKPGKECALIPATIGVFPPPPPPHFFQFVVKLNHTPVICYSASIVFNVVLIIPIFNSSEKNQGFDVLLALTSLGVLKKVICHRFSAPMDVGKIQRMTREKGNTKWHQN